MIAFCSSLQLTIPGSCRHHLSLNKTQPITVSLPQKSFKPLTARKPTTKASCKDENSTPTNSITSNKLQCTTNQITKSLTTILNKAVIIAATAFLFSSLSTNSTFATERGQYQIQQVQGGPLNGSPNRFLNRDEEQQLIQKRRGFKDFEQESVLSVQAQWDVHSIDSNTETLLIFANESSHVVDVWWIDYYGKEVFYGSINPNTTRVQPSFASHPWVVRDHVSQNSVLVLVAEEDPTMAIVKNVAAGQNEV